MESIAVFAHQSQMNQLRGYLGMKLSMTMETNVVIYSYERNVSI